MKFNWTALTEFRSPERSVNYDAWNRYVLIAIGVFALLLYAGLLYAGIAEFISRLSQRKNTKSRFRNRLTTRRFRNGRVSGS